MATIVTRAGKGSPLTHNEVDANFENLNSDKIETSAIGSTVQAHSAVLDATTASFTTADETKLDGIEAGATADQTAAEIKTAYESNADTNAFTDAEQSKLSGIEAGADVTDTANVTAAGALMDSELTNITAVKALDQGVATTDSPTFAGLTVGTVSATGGYVETGGDGTFTQAVFTAYRAGEGVQTGNFVRLRSVGDGAGNATQLIFDTNSSEAIRIGSAGQIGIGGANYGTSGQVLTSNGTGSAPSWQNRTIRVWAYYDGVGNSIKNSEGLSSVTDTAVGEPRFNFSSSVGTSAFCVTVHVMQSSEGNTQTGGYMDGAYVNDRTTTTLLMNTVNDSSTTTSSADMRQLDIQVTT